MASNKRFEQFPLVAFFLISFLVGIFCVFFVTDYSNHGAEERLELLHESVVKQLNSELFDLSHGIDVFADSVNFAVKSPYQLKDHSFIEELNRQVMARLIPVTQGMKGICNAYLRYNPDLCGSSTEGFFVAYDDNGVIEKLPVTPINDYKRSDIEHVGWYYIPEEKRVPMWLDPYRNENVGIYMFSYVVPVFSQNVFIGVVGIDVDLLKYIQNIESIEVFDCGKTFLIDRSGSLLTKNSPDEKKSIVISSKLNNDMIFGMFLPRSSSIFVQNTVFFRVIIVFYILILFSCIAYVFWMIVKKNTTKTISISSISQKTLELFFYAVLFSVIIIQVIFFSHEFISSRMAPEVTEVSLNMFDKTIYVCADKDFTPYTFASKTDKPSGFLVELMNVISNRLGYNVQMTLTSRAEAQKMLGSGDADIFLGAETTESMPQNRKNLLTNVIIDDTFEIIGKKSVEGLSNFENKSFAVIKGESQFNLYGIPHETVLFDSYREVIRAVKDGVCDFGYIRTSVANVLIHEAGINDIFTVYNLMNSHLAYAVSTDNEKLLGELNSVLDQLSSSGEIDNLYKKWIDFYEKEFSFYEIFRSNDIFYMITIVIFILSGILALYFRLKRLHSEGEKFSKNLMSQLEALSRNFVSMYLVDLKEDSYKEYKSRDYIRNAIESDDKLKGARALMPIVIRHTVTPEYLNQMLEFTNLDTLVKRIEGKSSIEMDFVGIYKGWCRGQFIALDVDDEGENRYFIWAVERIDEEKKREIELQYRSEIDLLTGIYNRGSGEARIRSLMGNGKNGMFILFDIDKFKTINDTFGHSIGDQVLIEVAKAMKACFRDNDVIVRFGGDEFAAYAVGALSEASGKMIFDRLFEQIDNINVPELKDKKISISIGAAFFTEDKEVSFEDIYKQADKCTYSSKAVNGNFFTFYKDV